MLDYELMAAGLKPYARHVYTLNEITLTQHAAHILCNGDY